MRRRNWLLAPAAFLLLGAGEALLTPTARWHGFYQAGAPGFAVVRTQAEYESFLDRIPAERIQKKQPAPPSQDPLLKRPAVDWSGQVGILAYSDNIHTEVEIEEIRLQPDGESVKVKVRRYLPPGAEHGARPYGYGQYDFVLIDRRTGEITEQP